MIALKTLICYALPALPLAALLMPVYIFLPTYYGLTLGLGLAAVGFARLLSGLWDVFTDPIIGIFSDKINPATRFFFGRRKMMIAAGLPFTLIGSWFLLQPEILGASFTTLIIFSFIMILGWTMMLLPLNALAGELAQDYAERNKINAFRESFSILGVLLPLAFITAFGFSGKGNEGEALRVIAYFVAITLPLFCFIFLLNVQEKPYQPQKFEKIKLKESFKILNENKSFLILIRSYFLNAVANGLPASLILIYISEILKKPELVGACLFIYFLCGLLSAPLWNFLGKKFEKHKIWCVSMLAACFIFAAIPFLGAGDITAYIIICILTGICFGADLIFPPSMQADVIDEDAARLNCSTRSGYFFALWGIATKFSLALATGLGFMIFEFLERQDWVLIMLYAIIPIVFKLFSLWGMWNFPLNKENVLKIQNQHRNV